MSTDSKSDLIIEASTRVFPRLGYHNATVEDILQEAGVARSTFYVYFSGKRELFKAVVTGMMNSIMEMIEAGVDEVIERFGSGDYEAAVSGGDTANGELELALVALMTSVFRFIETNSGMTRMFFNDLLVIDEEMTSIFYDFMDRFTGDFERLVRFGVDIGFLREVNERRAAEFIVGGLIHLAQIISAGIVDYDVEVVSREIVDVQLHGLRPASSVPAQKRKAGAGARA